MEQEIDVKPIKVNYLCDKCLIGTMEYNGSTNLGMTTSEYLHKCSNPDCKDIKTLDKKYPYITYRI